MNDQSLNRPLHRCSARPPVSLRSACILLALGLGAGACKDDTARTSEEGACEAGLLAGDLVITELMANPEGADAGNEWFEIYNASGSELNLTGVVLRLRKADGSGEKLHLVEEELIIAPEQYLVVGDRPNDDLPDYLDYGYGDDFGQGMNGGAGELAIGCGETAIDIAVYAGELNNDLEPEVKDGVTRTFDGLRTPDALGNDDLAAWCDATTEYAPDTFGTPGAPNDGCFGDMPADCQDGDALRPINPPMPGDLVITEFMADPSAVGDEAGEWFEVYVGRDVDLNGLSITKLGELEPDDIVGAVECLPASQGSYLVFAHERDATLNGGLPAVDHLFGLSLSNAPADGTGFSIGWGGQFIDTVTWASSGSGKASSLDPKFLTPNNEPDSFCLAETEYGAGDLGTPGIANDPCPIEAPEGMCVEDGELRDVRAPGVGDLWITEFLADPAAVADGDGEWFEVYADAAFDLNALQFGRDDEIEDQVDLGECRPVSPGDRLLFAKNAETAVNGGLSDVLYEIDMSLINSNGRLYIAANDEPLDVITWSGTTSGASRALDPSISGPEANDDEAVWCDGTESYGDGDFGTPGDENLACGGTPPGTCAEGEDVRDIVFAGEGDLVITEFMADPSAVADGDGEWFELLVNADVDLNGLQMGDDPASPDETIPASGDCIPVSAGTRIVLAHSTDMDLNGGLGDVAATFDFGLTNGGDTLFVGVGDVVIDELTWTGASAGASTSVVPGSEDAASNDDELNHCTSGTAYGAGDLGTPGAENVCE